MAQYETTSEVTVSQKVKVALLWLKDILESKQISYQIVGG
ncbi:MazG-related protein, partial [Vibrio cholerae]|nr:MazG-related protein [Vibrio cholerae]MCD1235195.1 MazG-related protein [Vibrio cholerae]MCD1242452.1 MazG-related protein [Vibrio cholerae]MCD1257187.1 MazG-related protein [Vibrio cholerae]